MVPSSALLHKQKMWLSAWTLPALLPLLPQKHYHHVPVTVPYTCLSNPAVTLTPASCARIITTASGLDSWPQFTPRLSLVFPPGCFKESPFLSLFRLQGASHISWFLTPFFHFQSQKSYISLTILPSSNLSLLLSCFPLPPLKTLMALDPLA